VISRLKRDRRFECGQVARDPVESGFGTSAVSALKGARRNRESASRDGSHGDCVEYRTWHRVFGARRLEKQVFGITSGDNPRLTVDHRESGSRYSIARRRVAKFRDIARPDLPIRKRSSEKE
jgi:hypothetical protein